MTDARIALGFLFIALYYVTLWIIGFRQIPSPENVALVKDALLQLGPPVGVIVGALFRTDRIDEQRVANTATALQTAQTAVANATSGEPKQVEVINDTASPVPVEAKE